MIDLYCSLAEWLRLTRVAHPGLTSSIGTACHDYDRQDKLDYPDPEDR